jgi:hypothetical protein
MPSQRQLQCFPHKVYLEVRNDTHLRTAVIVVNAKILAIVPVGILA